MNEFENQELVNQVEDENQVDNPQEQESTFQAEENASEMANNEPEAATEPETEPEESNDFEALQEQFNQLQDSYNELQSNYSAAQSRISELEEFQINANTELETLRTANAELQASIQTYEAQIVAAENMKKENLIEKYSKVLTAEEINEAKEKINDFSYEELESKLAITFANNKITSSDTNKVPLQEPVVESQFALLMKNYRK